MEVHSIVKPWPFRGWAMDLIGKIYPASSKGHNFIATDYFTKWVGAVPFKKAKQKDVIQFIKEHIIHRFRIPQSITTDQGIMFTRDEMTYFAKDYGIQLIRILKICQHEIIGTLKIPQNFLSRFPVSLTKITQIRTQHFDKKINIKACAYLSRHQIAHY